MNPTDYARFTETLIQTLAADERVIGLVAAGSMAATHHTPDRWSDHDFWVIVTPGSAEPFRLNFDWLPDAADIVFTLRETAHGLKVLYADGHMIEYAIFTEEELAVTRANAYRVLLDRGDVAAQMAGIREKTAAWSAAQRGGDAWLFGQFITNLWVGVGRHARGERLSGHRFVKDHAVAHLLTLIPRHVPPSADALDDIDPFRRFERAYPDHGAAINALLLRETPDAARGLLALADSLLRDRLPEYPADAVRVVGGVIAAASSS